ncbi:hypothetical protein SAMN06295912_108138 [Sphingomonas laterariae]|uniref:Uncharacterized protein n=1 Tax=Edaphosphingomonas laterariae TaxID=861865 RepID=A0A239FC63_9SPHN|nr:hypothetical protein [Sphingomonas laterariae]SNS53674.1 hypothetical protein SAMN06295912_108138 [Sphingomonas laterariae]
MTMMAYKLPEGAAELTAMGLCIAERESCGLGAGDATPSAGSIALATWLLADRARAARLARRSDSPLAMGYATRQLLAGKIVPSEQLADAIARMTGGAVAAREWELSANKVVSAADQKEADGDLRSASCGGGGARSAPDAGCEAPASAPAAFPDDQSALAVLGETPSGPLFACLPPTRTCPFYEVHGLGLSFRLDDSRAVALHAALGVALGARAAAPVLDAAA